MIRPAKHTKSADNAMPTKNAKKQRLSVYLDPKVMASLAAYAARREQSRSLIAEAAIASFLSPDAAEQQEAVLTKRLDQLDRRMTRLERDLSIAVETLAVFVRFWLTTNPPLPEPAQAAARAERAIEPQITAIYRRFGLNDRQIDILSRATPKRDYYCQSQRGNRLFELGLSEIALALCAASAKADQAAIAQILTEHGRDGFLAAWLRHRGLDWAAELIPALRNLRPQLAPKVQP